MLSFEANSFLSNNKHICKVTEFYKLSIKSGQTLVIFTHHKSYRNSQTENSLHKYYLSLRDLYIDACFDVVRYSVSKISEGLRAAISRFTMPTHRSEIIVDLNISKSTPCRINQLTRNPKFSGQSM